MSVGGRRFEWVPGVAADGLSLPRRQTALAAGYDLCAAEAVAIAPGALALVPTGVRALIPAGEFLAIFPRSSLALRHRLVLANGVGVVDADYYGNPDNGGHILIPLWNLGGKEALLARGTRVAQGIFMRCEAADGDAPAAALRAGGFGSTDAGITPGRARA